MLQVPKQFSLHMSISRTERQGPLASADGCLESRPIQTRSRRQSSIFQLVFNLGGVQ